MLDITCKDEKSWIIVKEILARHNLSLQQTADKTKRYFIHGASEIELRLLLQEELDAHPEWRPTKHHVLLEGNSVYSLKQVGKDWALCRKGGIDRLTDYLYKFFSLNYTIAHYNRHGWIHHYQEIAREKGLTPVTVVAQMIAQGGELGLGCPRWASDRKRIQDEIFGLGTRNDSTRSMTIPGRTRRPVITTVDALAALDEYREDTEAVPQDKQPLQQQMLF